MSWIDFAFIFVWLVFIGMGFRLGGIWVGSCIFGGFFGAHLADYYALPLAEHVGHFPAVTFLSGSFLFLIGLGVVLLAGYLIQKSSRIFFLGIFDRVVGGCTGALVGLTVLSIAVLSLTASNPKWEGSKSWKKSIIARPYKSLLQKAFELRNERVAVLGRKLSDKAIQTVKPIANKVIDKVADEIKK